MNEALIEKRLAIAVKALKFYAETEVFAYPKGWDIDHSSVPTLEDYDRVDGVAEKALAEIESVQ